MSNLFRRPAAQLQELEIATIRSPVEEELENFTEIISQIESHMSGPPESNQSSTKLDPEEHANLLSMFDFGIQSRNTLHRLITDGDEKRAIKSRYKALKERFEYLRYAYFHLKPIEQKPKEETMYKIKRKGRELRDWSSKA